MFTAFTGSRTGIPKGGDINENSEKGVQEPGCRRGDGMLPERYEAKILRGTGGEGEEGRTADCKERLTNEAV